MELDKQNGILAAATVAFALKKVGQKEATGHNDGKFVRKIQDFIDGLGKWMDGQPWCAAFATWCIYQVADGVNQTPILKKNGSSTSIFAEAKKKNLVLHYPIPHCIGLLRGDGGTPGKTHHHTFLVTDVDPKQGVVFGVDGNWKNAVSRTVHKIYQCDFVAIA
jgi:hypothetical protein